MLAIESIRGFFFNLPLISKRFVAFFSALSLEVN